MAQELGPDGAEVAVADEDVFGRRRRQEAVPGDMLAQPVEPLGVTRILADQQFDHALIGGQGGGDGLGRAHAAAGAFLLRLRRLVAGRLAVWMGLSAGQSRLIRSSTRRDQRPAWSHALYSEATPRV